MKKRIAFSVFLMLILMSWSVSGAEDLMPLPSQAQAPGEGSSALPEVKTYDELRHAISEARAAGRTRVEKAVEKERVREAWEVGRLIDGHVLLHKERADYGKQVLLRLSKDLGMSDTELGYMLQFARTYPISQPAGKLSWSHYMELLSLNDVKEQTAVADMAEKGKWTRDQTREEVKKRKAANNETPAPVRESPLAAEPGKVGTYRIVKAAAGPETGKRVIDLGFSNYYKTSRDLRFKEGAILEAVPAIPGASAPSDTIKLSKRTSADLYTYRAYAVRVLDGDTLEVVVDLGFGMRSVQTLRLRGLDCPELVSKEGKEAKAFVEKALQIPGNGEPHGGLDENSKRGTQAQAEPVIARSPTGATRQSQPSILIKTVKSDKYDRYLADLFFTDPEGKQQYLNNMLLEKGHAVRVRE